MKAAEVEKVKSLETEKKRRKRVIVLSLFQATLSNISFTTFLHQLQKEIPGKK